MNDYSTSASGCFGETETVRDYTQLRKIQANPDRFEELKKYNPAKIISWSLVGLAGLTALLFEILISKEINNKK